MGNRVDLNLENRLYILHFSGGYTCLGFDVCFEKATFMAKELNKPAPVMGETADGLRIMYEYYTELEDLVIAKNAETGWQSKCWLTPQLIGLERKRVEVIDCYGEKRRFIVGKSTGAAPCHLELSNISSKGGGAVTGAPFQSLKVIS